MGNHRFKLAYMIPNAWFYKLKTVNRAAARRRRKRSLPGTSPDTAIASSATTPKKPSLLLQPNRQSYYYSTMSRKEKKFHHHHLPFTSPIHPAFADPPRSSSARRSSVAGRPASRIVASALASGCRCRAWRSDHLLSTSGEEDDNPRKPIAGAGVQRSDLCSATDIAGKNPSPKVTKKVGIELRPISTKPNRGEKPALAPARKQYSPGIHRLKIAGASPEMKKKKERGRGVCRSFAVVKASSDPEGDFRESMVEMIVENGIWSSRDLEELLACYLSLNSGEYHAVIVEVFRQIWLDIAGAGSAL